MATSVGSTKRKLPGPSVFRRDCKAPSALPQAFGPHPLLPGFTSPDLSVCLPPGIQQPGETLPARGAQDPTPHPAQPQRGEGRQAGGPWPQGQRSGLGDWFPRDVSQGSCMGEGDGVSPREGENPQLGSILPYRLRKRLSVSESSHTESDSSPPLGVRRRCSGVLDAPRFPDTDEAGSSPRQSQQLTEGVAFLTPQPRDGGPGSTPEQLGEHKAQGDKEPGLVLPSSVTA